MLFPNNASDIRHDSQVKTPICNSSPWALIPAVLTVITAIVRTALEDRTLKEELDGYKEYAGQVRHRFLRGIW